MATVKVLKVAGSSESGELKGRRERTVIGVEGERTITTH